MNLKDDGYIVNVNNVGIDVFKLTKPGFYEAKRLIHPYTTAIVENKKWCFIALFTVINVTAAVVSLAIRWQCP